MAKSFYLNHRKLRLWIINALNWKWFKSLLHRTCEIQNKNIQSSWKTFPRILTRRTIEPKQFSCLIKIRKKPQDRRVIAKSFEESLRWLFRLRIKMSIFFMNFFGINLSPSTKKMNWSTILLNWISLHAKTLPNGSAKIFYYAKIINEWTSVVYTKNFLILFHQLKTDQKKERKLKMSEMTKETKHFLIFPLKGALRCDWLAQFYLLLALNN